MISETYLLVIPGIGEVRELLPKWVAGNCVVGGLQRNRRGVGVNHVSAFG